MKASRMKITIALVIVLVAVTSAAEIWKGKKYKLYESDQFDEYMKELGVGYILRRIGNSVYPTVSLTKSSKGKYKLITESTFRNTELNFKLGKEFDEETLDGRTVKTIMTLEGNKLIQNQGGEKPTTIIREFGETEMVATLKAGKVTSIRKYRVEG